MSTPAPTTPAETRRTPQLFAFLFCSLDGFVEDAEKRLDWSTSEPEVFTWQRQRARQVPHVGSMLLGRNTYDHFAEFWPSSEAYERYPEIAAFMHETPKTVVTSRPETLSPWHEAQPAEGGDLPALVEQLRADHDGDIAVFGSSILAAQLLEQGLLQELRILVSPVVLGSGTGLFQGLSQRVHLTPGSTTMFPSGNVLLTYTPQAAHGKSAS